MRRGDGGGRPGLLLQQGSGRELTLGLEHQRQSEAACVSYMIIQLNCMPNWLALGLQQLQRLQPIDGIGGEAAIAGLHAAISHKTAYTRIGMLRRAFCVAVPDAPAVPGWQDSRKHCAQGSQFSTCMFTGPCMDRLSNGERLLGHCTADRALSTAKCAKPRVFDLNLRGRRPTTSEIGLASGNPCDTSAHLRRLLRRCSDVLRPTRRAGCLPQV